jgi:hypothetical protein
LADAHLLLMRELAHAGATFESLRQRTGLAPEALAQHLAALYLVGSITANPRRAAPMRHAARSDGRDPSASLPPSVAPSGLGNDSGAGMLGLRAAPADLTAPAPMVHE